MHQLLVDFQGLLLFFLLCHTYIILQIMDPVNQIHF
jgi:hypothetical protein